MSFRYFFVRVDLALGRNPRPQPAQQPGPISPPDEHHREVLDLVGLCEGDRLEQLVEGADPPGKITKPCAYFTNIILLIGLLIIAIFLGSWGVSTLIYRWKGYDHLATSAVPAPSGLDRLDEAA